MPPRVEIVMDSGGVLHHPTGPSTPPGTCVQGVEVYSIAELLEPTFASGTALGEDGQLLEDTVRWLCMFPEQAHVYELRRQTTLYEIEVAPADVSKILGREWQNLSTLRALFERRSMPRTLVEVVTAQSLRPRTCARALTPRSEGELGRLVARLVERFVGPPEVATVTLTSSVATALIEIWRANRARRVPRDLEYTCTSIHHLVMRMRKSLGKRIILNIC